MIFYHSVLLYLLLEMTGYCYTCCQRGQTTVTLAVRDGFLSQAAVTLAVRDTFLSQATVILAVRDDRRLLHLLLEMIGYCYTRC
jgi:hypothetical protein